MSVIRQRRSAPVNRNDGRSGPAPDSPPATAVARPHSPSARPPLHQLRHTSAAVAKVEGGGAPLASSHHFSLLGDLLGAELGWGSALVWSRYGRAEEHAINFLRVPFLLERFVSFGHALCADLFLFHFTWLPLRFAYSLMAGGLALLRALEVLCTRWMGFPAHSRPAPALRFGRAQVYDLLKGVILITATLVLGMVQISRVYHYVRGEAVIKLYVVYNVLGVVDALFSSLGQDIMDALYRTTRDHLRPFVDDGAVDDVAAADAPVHPTISSRTALLRLAGHFAIAVGYVTLHACVIFVQIVCLNVAMNSKNNALLTLLVSTNFVELKGTVFKRFEAENLFQVAASDAVERFSLSLFLVLIGLQELSSVSALMQILPSILVIWGAEVAVDYVKHSFTSKFNRLSADLFTTYSAVLAHDLIAVRQRMANSMDPTHACVRRLGLATLPLACVVLRMALAKVGTNWLPRLNSATGWGAIGLGAALLFAAKMLLNMLLLVHSAAIVREQQDLLARAVAGATPAATRAATLTGAVATAGPLRRSGGADTPVLTTGTASAAPVPGGLWPGKRPSLSSTEPHASPASGPYSARPFSWHEGGPSERVGRSGRVSGRGSAEFSATAAVSTTVTAERVEALLMLEQISTVDRWALRAKMIPI